jgi:hypothetical protein
MENKRAKLGNLPNYLSLFSIKKLTFLFILSCIISCKPSKVTTIVSEKIRIDTIRDYKVITKYNAIHDTLTIDNPCDSAGILTTFYSKITLPQGKVIIRSYKGSIKATIDIDSIASVYEKKYRNKETNLSQNSTKIVTRNIIPSWAIITILIESLIIIGYLYFRFLLSR